MILHAASSPWGCELAAAPPARPHTARMQEALGRGMSRLWRGFQMVPLLQPHPPPPKALAWAGQCRADLHAGWRRWSVAGGVISAINGCGSSRLAVAPSLQYPLPSRPITRLPRTCKVRHRQSLRLGVHAHRRQGVNGQQHGAGHGSRRTRRRCEVGRGPKGMAEDMSCNERLGRLKGNWRKTQICQTAQHGPAWEKAQQNHACSLGKLPPSTGPEVGRSACTW